MKETSYLSTYDASVVVANPYIVGLTAVDSPTIVSYDSFNLQRHE
jgi:hypothetical protein